MSKGEFQNVVYETDASAFYPARVQPETLTLTLNTVANAEPSGTVVGKQPSAILTGGRKQNGVIGRRVRIKFNTTTVPPGYKINTILTLPVLSKTVFDGWGKGATGTYTIDGTAYSVAFVGSTPEKIN